MFEPEAARALRNLFALRAIRGCHFIVDRNGLWPVLLFLQKAASLQSGLVKPEWVGVRPRRPGEHLAVSGEGGLGLPRLGQGGGALAGGLVAPVGRGGEVGGQTGIHRGGLGKAWGFVAAQSKEGVGFFHQRGVANLGRWVATEDAVVEGEGIGKTAVTQEKGSLLEAGAVAQGRAALGNLVKRGKRAPCPLRAHAAGGGLRGKEFGQGGGFGLGLALGQLGQDRFRRGVVTGPRVKFSEFEGNVGSLRCTGVGGEEFGRSSDQFLAGTRTGIVCGENFRGGEGGGAWRGVGLGLCRAQDAFRGGRFAPPHAPLGQGKFGLEGVIDSGGAPGEGVESVNLPLPSLSRSDEEGPADEVGIAGFALAEELKGTAGQREVLGREGGDKAVCCGGGLFLRGCERL